MNLSGRWSWLSILILSFLAFPSIAAKLSPSSLMLSPGESGVVTISKSKGSPSLSNSNTGVVSATLAGNRITVKAIMGGTATLSITDRAGTQVSTVTVMPPMSVSPGFVSLPVGQSTNLTISNAAGEVKLKNSNEEAVATELARNLVKVTGKRQGSAFLTLSDGKTQVVVQVNVSSTTPPPSTGGNSTGRLLASNCYQCHGTNGSGGFDRLRGSQELLQELREFASGREDADGIMAAHALGYSDAQMQAIADYLANQ